MKAIIMAAGKGVRMRPLTDHTPKALLKVVGVPILERTLRQLPDQVEEAIVVVGYHGDQIRNSIAENFDGKKITFVEENEMKGTGKAVAVCRDLIDGDFLAVNGDDLYLRSDLEKLARADGMAMLAKDVSREPDFPEQYQRFGKIVLDGDFNFIKYVTQGMDFASPFYAVMGAYRLPREFFEHPLEEMANGELSLPHTIFAMAQKRGLKIIPAEFWAPIGFPGDLEKAGDKLREI